MDQAKHNGLKNSTRQLYLRETFPQHIVPYLGHLRLDKVTPDIVRDWHSELKEHLRDGSSTVARSYRLLRSIINTAVEDEIIQRNPCRIKGAGNTKAAERPALGLPEIRDLAQARPEHYRALVQLLVWSGSRIGEGAVLQGQPIWQRLGCSDDPSRQRVQELQRCDSFHLRVG